MEKKLVHHKIFVKKSRTHGFGVFAAQTIKKGTLLEECYIIISRKGGDKALEDYYFDVKGKYGVFLGYGSIYNHSDDPNADYFIYAKRRIAKIKAARTIRKGEEIFVSYGEDWFKDRGVKPKNKEVKVTKKSKKRKKSK